MNKFAALDITLLFLDFFIIGMIHHTVLGTYCTKSIAY